MVKCVFSMSLRGLQELINSVFKFIQLPLSCPRHLCISTKAKTVNITFMTKNKVSIQHLAIYSTDLKIYGEGECKVKKYGINGTQWVQRKLNLAINININMHAIIAAELRASNLTDGAVLPNLFK